MAIVTVASEERGRKSGGKKSLVEEGRGIGMCRWGGARQESALEDSLGVVLGCCSITSTARARKPETQTTIG